LIFVMLVFFSSSFGQDPVDTNTAPPPLKLLSADERKQLNSTIDVKKRTKLALDLMELRIKSSETSRVSSEYDAMFNALGGFQAIVDDTLEFLFESDKDKKKVIFNFKRFEIGLRAFSPRLELLRREVPPQYQAYIRELILDVRDARAKAIEPLFSDSVVPRRPREN
ncbi:MAG: hypothetical protein ACT4O9_16740, partial [Blastocatellia bacterium]